MPQLASLLFYGCVAILVIVVVVFCCLDCFLLFPLLARVLVAVVTFTAVRVAAAVQVLSLTVFRASLFNGSPLSFVGRQKTSCLFDCSPEDSE